MTTETTGQASRKTRSSLARKDNPMRRLVTATLAALGAAGAISLTSGCGAMSQPVTYAPAAYGIPGHCYYVNSPAEAIALHQAGLCPRSWMPTVMPLAWHEEYDAYYGSPAYYGTYVPARARVVYVSRERAFGRTYRSAIRSRSMLATYRSSSGTLVKGTKLTGTPRFGSGTSFGSSGRKYGGGGLRSTGRSGGSSGYRPPARSGGGSLRSGGRH